VGRPAPPHRCPQGPTDKALLRLLYLIDRYARDNIAPLPITMELEGDTWTVDITVHIPRVCEYEVTGEGETLSDALSNANKRFSHQYILRQQSDKDAEDFLLTH